MSLEKPKYGRTFPLYLPAIDWYFLCDETPKYPMVFYVDLDFTGKLDRQKMNLALEEAVYRHPLMFCVIQRAKQNKLCWVLADDKMPQIDWASDDVPLNFEGGDFIDMRNQTGLRVWVRESETGARMTMQFHHTVCDGTGAYRFVGDLLGCYMRRFECCRDQVKMGEFDPAQLKTRPAKMRSLKSTDSTFKKFRSAIGEAWKQFGQRVSALEAPAEPPKEKILPGMVKQEFSAEDLAKLRTSATSRGATMNDLLLVRMFQTARKWNKTAGSKSKFRILVPSDMRDGGDFEMPACNMTAYTFITRRGAEIDDEAKLLELICNDTFEIKNGNLQKEFVNSLNSAMVVPPLLPWVLHLNRCLSTSILSNAGDPSRRFTCRLPKKRGKVSCDEFTLDAITGVPPLRQKTRCTLSSSIYGRQLTFSMRCDPHSFSQAESEKLLALFCDQIRLDL